MNGHSTLSLSLSRFPRAQRGFTLVELSIVLVIIGLLIGGILVGQSLIESAKTQAQIRQLQQFDIATNNFITKINQIPGDCSLCSHPDWPGICSYPNCQGNNDGSIAGSCNGSPNNLECAYFFSDLVQIVGLSGSYDRPHTALYAGTTYGNGEIAPSAAIGKGGVVPAQNSTGELYWILTGDLTYGYLSQAAPSITPAQALALDAKLDDALPGSGGVVLAWPTGPNTRPELYPLGTGFSTDEANPPITAYRLSVDSPYYQMQIKANVSH